MSERQGPWWFQCVESNFRHENGRLVCAYVVVTAVESDGQRRALRTRHLTGRPEQIVDDVLQAQREFTLEYVLSQEEPF